MGEHRDDTGEHKSLEETVLENIDRAAKTAEEPARAALHNTDFMRRVVIFLAFYTALVACACTYAIWQVQKVLTNQQQYLLEQCVAGNESRAAERNVITTLVGGELELAQQEGYVPTTEELKLLADLNTAADKAWPQRDCSGVDDGEIVNVTPSISATSRPESNQK